MFKPRDLISAAALALVACGSASAITFTPPVTIPTDRYVSKAAIMPDGRGVLLLWDPIQQKEEMRFQPSPGGVWGPPTPTCPNVVAQVEDILFDDAGTGYVHCRSVNGSWVFTLKNGQWTDTGHPAVGGFDSPVSDFSIAVAGSGIVYTAWTQQTPGQSVYVSQRSPGGTWSPPQLLSAGNSPDVTVAANARGDAVLVWDDSRLEALPTATSDGEVAWVSASVHPAGGGWEAPVKLTSDAPAAGASRSRGLTTIDDAGRATIVWMRRDVGRVPITTFSTVTRAVAPGSPWSSPAQVTTGADPAATLIDEFHRLSGNGRGELLFLGNVPTYAMRRLATGVWKAPVRPPAPTGVPASAVQNFFGQQALLPTGEGVLAATYGTSAAPGGEVMVTSQSASGVFSAPKPVEVGTAAAPLDTPRMASNRAGDVILAYNRGKSPARVVRVTTSLASPLTLAPTLSKRKFKAKANATQFRLTLSSLSSVTITVGGVPGKLVRNNLKPGTVNIPFNGRIGSRVLKPGNYTATLVAMRGKVKAPPVKLKFTILP